MKIRIRGNDYDVRPTITDRLVTWINPAKGLQRMRARTVMTVIGGGGYQAGRRDRRNLRGWRTGQNSANVDTLPDLPDLRTRSRDLVRNVPIAAGAVATAITNIVGEGLIVQSAIDAEFLGLSGDQAKAWQQQAQREFSLWIKTADFTLKQSFYEMQALIFRSILESGDVLVVRRFREDPGDVYGLKLQVVEADRISNRNNEADTPTRTAGVKLDADGVTVGWQISTRHPDDNGMHGSTASIDWLDVPAWSRQGRPLALHLFDRTRGDLVRGVPWLAPVIEAIKMLGDYSEAEVRAAVISAMFTVFITDEVGDAADEENEILASSTTNPSQEVQLDDAGAVVHLDGGQDVKIADPKRPNERFDPFVQAVLRQIGVALELPFEILIKHFTASYSASRAALETAWQFFRRRRIWLSRNLCQPVYEWLIEEAIARGRLKAPRFFEDPLIRQAYLRSQWIGPPRISLDPLKDANAAKTELENGTTTRAEIITGRGGDPDAVHQQLVAEAKRRQADGLTAPAPAPVRGQQQLPPPADPAADPNAPADQNDQKDAQT